MSPSDKSKSQAVPSYYDAHYGYFQAELYSEIRRESSGEDVGQNSWLTAGEQDKFLSRNNNKSSSPLRLPLTHFNPARGIRCE